MTSTYEHGKEERAERSKECDMVRMLTEKFLSQLDKPVHTARCLHHTGTGHSSNDDIDNIRRRISRFHTETEHENGQSYTRDCAKSKATIA